MRDLGVQSLCGTFHILESAQKCTTIPELLIHLAAKERVITISAFDSAQSKSISVRQKKSSKVSLNELAQYLIFLHDHSKAMEAAHESLMDNMSKNYQDREGDTPNYSDFIARPILHLCVPNQLKTKEPTDDEKYISSKRAKRTLLAL